jgi:hypothetical protein
MALVRADRRTATKRAMGRTVRGSPAAPMDASAELLGQSDDDAVRGLRVALVALGVLILVGVLWGASELHYRSCVSAAESRTPVTTSSTGMSILQRTKPNASRSAGGRP